MKVLLDENLSQKLRSPLPKHDVVTVRYMGWAGLKNGELIRTAEAGGFEVLITADQSLSYQQNLEGRKIAVVTLSVPDWVLLQDHLEKIADAVDAATPGSFQFVDCGRFRRS